MMDLLEMILILLATLCIGIFASLVGIGGGAFFVPFFNLVLGMPIEDAIGSSLFTIIFISLSSAIYFAWKKRIDYKTALAMELATVPGAIIGANVTELLPEVLLKFIFALFLLGSSVKLIKTVNNKKAYNSPITASKKVKRSRIEWHRTFVDANGNTWDYSINVPTMLIGGFIAGFASGLLGIGGGIVKVPLLTVILGIPVHIATATSTFMMLLTSTSGGTTHYLLGHVHFEIVSISAIGAILGAQIGTRLNTKVSSKNLRKIVAIVFIIMSLYMLYNSISLLLLY